MWLKTMLKHRRRWLAPATALVALLTGLVFGTRWVLLTMSDPLANLQGRAAKAYEPDPASAAAVKAPAPEISSDVPSHETSALQAPPNPPLVEPQYLVQLGAFRSEARANRLAQAATKAGFPSSVVRGSNSSAEALFRVHVDQAFDKSHAERLAGEARDKISGVDPIVVWHDN